MEPCIFFNFRRVDRLISQWYDLHLQKAGLKNTQFSMLRALTAVGPQPISTLADMMDVDRTTLTRNLRLLEKEGWLEQRQGDDRRVRNVHLTKAGIEKYETAQPYWEQAQKALVDQYGQENWLNLRGQLHQIADLAKHLNPNRDN